jgi:hypothetical protein
LIIALFIGIEVLQRNKTFVQVGQLAHGPFIGYLSAKLDSITEGIPKGSK